MTATVSAAQRFSRDRSCPICNGHPILRSGHGVRCYGFLSSDGRYAHCTREDYAGGLQPEPSGGTFAHRLDGPCRCGLTHGEPKSSANEPSSTLSPKPIVVQTRRWKHGCVDGEPIEHVRQDLSTDEKRVWWERGGRRGLRGLRIADLPLYGAANLTAAGKKIVVEGEPATDAGAGLGIPVVGTVTGAKSIPCDESLRPLLGGTVYLWPDNDPDGERHMAQIAQRLLALGQPPADMRRLVWEGAPPKGDAADWLGAGGTPEELGHLIAAAPVWIPADQASRTETPSAAPQASCLIVRQLTDIVARPVDWLWPRWLPRGKFLLMGGYAGDGKSTLLASLAAEATRAGHWPDGTRITRPIRSLFILGEDSAEDTLKPRLELHHADMANTLYLETVLDGEGQERFFNIAKHLSLLEAAIGEFAIEWVIIDPLTTIMPGTDRNAEGATRDALTPLVKLADRLNVTITGVAHVGKSDGTRRAAQKILGATAFHAMARIVWMIAPDGADHMALGVAKSNLAMKPLSLAWSREEDGPICWKGLATQDVEELLATTAAASPRSDAERFLREFLAAGAQPALVVQQAAKEHGISEATLRRASVTLQIKKWKAPGTNGVWYWMLPDGTSPSQPPTSSDPVGNLLTPIDFQVSKLSKFPHAKVRNGDSDEHLHATTPIRDMGHVDEELQGLEGAQLAHPSLLGGEQVPSVAYESRVADRRVNAKRYRL